MPEVAEQQEEYRVACKSYLIYLVLETIIKNKSWRDRREIMKKIIQGKLYDTETAHFIGEWSTGQYGSFDYMQDRLFQTKKGTYFIAYEGGANSPYAIIEGNEQHGAEGIRLLTEDEAKTWSMEHLEADEYIKLFGEVEEG